MFEMPKPDERYIIGGYIKRGDSTVLDIAVEAIDTPESIRKAMNTVRRAMTNYAPNTTPIIIAADQAKTAHTAARVAIPVAEQAVAAPEPTTPPLAAASDQEPDSQPTPATTADHKPDKPLEGVRGLLHLRCEECGKPFTTFLKMKQQEIACRCGHITDPTKPLARLRYTCPYCEMERWGWTNLEDTNISVKCKCGGMVDMQWVPKAKEYRN